MRLVAGIAACLYAATVAGCAAISPGRGDRAADPAQIAARRALSHDAQLAIDSGDWEKARVALVRLAAETPRSAEVFHRLGRVYDAEGLLHEAEKAYRHALELDPDYADALIGLGHVEAIRGRTTAALKHIEAAVELDPARAEAHLARGRLLDKLGKTDEALASYFRTLGADPASTPAMLRIAEIQLTRGQNDQALVRLSHVLDLTPDYSEAHYLRGRAHLALGHVPEAIDDLRIASTRLPQRPDVFYHLALALEQAQKTPEAIRAADQAVKLAPNYAGAQDLSRRLRR
jgi:tetratricopeptide (TPR) repeat protein